MNLSKKKKKRSRITSFINRQILSDSHQLVKAGTHTKNCLIILCRFYNIMCLTSINTTHSVISYPSNFHQWLSPHLVMSCALHLSRSPHYIKSFEQFLALSEAREKKSYLSISRERRQLWSDHHLIWAWIVTPKLCEIMEESASKDR